MPPSSRIKKEDVLAAAVEITRQSGAAALNARALAQRLGCSTQPIFSNYGSMDMLREDVIRYAGETYGRFIAEDIASGKYPPYKASGMAYIRFAADERELFKLLFMRDRSGERNPDEQMQMEPVYAAIRESTGLGAEDARLFHLEMWVCVHGIATMVATSYQPWDRELISRVLTDIYQGLRARFLTKE